MIATFTPFLYHLKKITYKLALAFLCMTLPTTTRAVNYSYIPHLVVASATGYVASQVYVAYTLQSTAERFASVRYILATCPHNQTQCQQALKREMLRKHDQMVHSYWFGAPTYATLPLVWYVKKLDCTLSSLTWLSWINTDCERAKELHDLIADLRAIRDYIVTDYDYIREQRMWISKKQ